jgi:hypothetical protein
VAISTFGVIKRGDKTREHCIWGKNPLKIANIFIKGTCLSRALACFPFSALYRQV